MMRKSRPFRPTVSETRLEDRVALSVATSALVAPVARPVATSSEVTATLNQLHNALVSYQGSVTNAVQYEESQIASGRVTQATAVGLLNTYIGNKTSLLFSQTRAAAANLPYGAGFNGFLNHTNTAVGDLPSGGNSLYFTLAQFPTMTSTTTGPIYTIQNNVFTALTNNSFNGMLGAVNSTALHSTFARVKTIVTSYVLNGVKAHDFTLNS